MATITIKSGDSDNQATVTSQGALGVTNPIADGYLRQLVSNTSGGVTPGSSGFGTLSPGYPTQITIGNTSSLLLPANTSRVYAHIFNNSAQPIYIQYQAVAALNQGIRINPGNYFTLSGDDLWLGDVNAIGLISGQQIDVLEGI